MGERRDDADAPRVPLTTIAKVTSIILEVARENGAIGVRELARKTGVDRSAVSRIAADLRELGILAETPDGTCAPGPELWALSSYLRRSTSIDAAAGRAVSDLASRFRETAAAVIVGDTGARVMHASIAGGPVAVILTPGALAPVSISNSRDDRTPVVATHDGATYISAEVGSDEAGRRWWLLLALPEHRATAETISRAQRVLSDAVSTLRLETSR